MCIAKCDEDIFQSALNYRNKGLQEKSTLKWIDKKEFKKNRNTN